MSRNLLPPNVTTLQRTLADKWAGLEEVDPSVIETIWDAWRCPAVLLPWLAEAMSVDLWEPGWSEIQQREAIAASPAYHRLKATRRSVRMALELLDRPFTMTEWWQRTPPARRGTSRVFVEVATFAEAAAMQRLARRLVNRVKPKSRAVFVAAGLAIPGDIVVAAAVHSRETIVVEPFQLAINDVDAPIDISTAVGSTWTVTVDAKET